MSRRSVKMPDVGEGITEVEIVEWTVEVGDAVREDEILASVMTDKATVEIPTPVDGRIVSLNGEVGQMTPVGTVIAVIETDDVSSDQTTSVVEQETSEDELEVPASEAEAQPPSVPAETKEKESEKASVPRRNLRQEPDHPIAQGRLPRPEGEKPVASPSVRKRAMDAGIRLAFVHGSGPAGRILHEDLDAFIAGEKTVAARTGAKPNTSVREHAIVGLRRRIAERMQDAVRRIPHITYVDEVDMTELESLRKHMNDRRREDQPRLTVLPYLMLAMVHAIKAYSKFSAHFDDEAGIVHEYGAAHIGMATQTDSGLMVPVVRHAEASDIWSIADEIGRLSSAARDGSIKRDELTGSTITISSLGQIGGIVSTPVINSPEVAVVGVNRIIQRPVYIDGTLVPRKIMNLSSSFDHRFIDGWDAAQFIQHIKQSLEHPATLFMEQ
ncbi:2-oxo acid dehydrogenase subunit E2 [Hoeflea sp. WL0058]|uniref:Dihydrolipoamide acetyltransferase component of pyruvate dehydrogenase complex n=1 Tax=Flavimaribacter sediminis TaxID=2865987 RepID=A0AAE3D0N0_9HYPH|nr:dihydrolipoamide acetyltransferase family protein [Flavimaribacter sediminis]MBW8636936.1 2-oxo acid dehydrogenase subunit E2 [Flavimaribacter sediminis]